MMKNNIYTEQSRSVHHLRFPEFDGEWIENKLGEVADTIGGGTPATTKKEYWGGDIIWLTPTEIKEKFISKSTRTITSLGLQKSSAKILPKGTLLFTSRATIGDVGISEKECSTNQGFQSFIPNANYDTFFLYNWIIKNKKEFLRKASGSTFLEISITEISKIKIILPT
ncbi:MAG: restriction endonuclease subunit S, partial [Bacteroidales bacterium]|nr:restriction endonuclease subunit S [Bacteroidales bacterium]